MLTPFIKNGDNVRQGKFKLVWENYIVIDYLWYIVCHDVPDLVVLLFFGNANGRNGIGIAPSSWRVEYV
jgi:hypothetical protein